MFTEEMFNAVVEGRKTQTRRKMKQQPKNFYNKIPCKMMGEFREHFVEIKPKYEVGEILYLKEPYCIHEPCAPIHNWIEYKYDCDIGRIKLIDWKNKLFMSAKYARYFIEIVSVKCESVQDISDEDCKKEGIYYVEEGLFYTWSKDAETYNTPQEAYSALFNKINGKGALERNEWVWVYGFKLVNNN
jgi:hypothetical protein